MASQYAKLSGTPSCSFLPRCFVSRQMKYTSPRTSPPYPPLSPPLFTSNVRGGGFILPYMDCGILMVASLVCGADCDTRDVAIYECFIVCMCCLGLPIVGTSIDNPGNTKPRVCGQEGPAHASAAMVTQTQTWNTTCTPRPGLGIMCVVSPGGKAQKLRPTALTPAREAGTWNGMESTSFT